ncbi:BCCT family transporter [Embleya sp. NBC_00888]|uniref:BCCT family transporter n=1 Tax=Embleya sp. NBC_00888 TaxID=2975960 RepID=UPI00386FB988|nr:BCCT family transporter [Embleya sp. NBC_00888]
MSGSSRDDAAAPRVDPVVAAIGFAVVLAVVLWGVLAKGSLDTAASTGLDWTIRNFGWLFVVAADTFLVLAVFIAASKYGRIRLGEDDDEPEFRTGAWVAMMFSAGMGIGLMFYAVAEPIQHFAAPPPASGAVAQTPSAAGAALEWTLFHWTLHPWAIYAIAGLALAYATFRRGRGNRVSAAFVPLLGRHADGAAGQAIDLLAIFATVFGSATSLGLGALQVAKGLDLTTDIKDTSTLHVVIIIALTAAFVVSAFSGIHRGVKWLSTANVLLALVLMLFVFVVGPTVYVLGALPASVGSYLNDLLTLATRTGTFGGDAWMGSWTIFYWAWWLSWAPFVGTFIARISRGRTVRQFVIGVLLVPSGASTIWFAVMGGTALRLQQTGAADLVTKVADGPESGLFAMLDALPLYAVTATVAMVLVALYFVTGADSASLVLGSLTSRGSLKPARWLVVGWGALIGAVAAVLLVAGGLTALQQATILVALPFVLVMLALCVALLKDLNSDPMVAPGPRRMRARGLSAAVRATVGDEGEGVDAEAFHRHHGGI